MSSGMTEAMVYSTVYRGRGEGADKKSSALCMAFQLYRHSRAFLKCLFNKTIRQEKTQEKYLKRLFN